MNPAGRVYVEGPHCGPRLDRRLFRPVAGAPRMPVVFDIHSGRRVAVPAGPTCSDLDRGLPGETE